MIKVKKGEITLKGHPVELCTELASAVKGVAKALEENGMPMEDAVGMVRKSVELAFKTEVELKKEASGIMARLLTNMADALREGEDNA